MVSSEIATIVGSALLIASQAFVFTVLGVAALRGKKAA